MAGEFFRMRNIVKSYRMGGEEQVVLKGIDLDIQPGEFLSILGPSGSGKTTLMNLIGCLDTPTSGEYILDGQLIRALSEKELSSTLDFSAAQPLPDQLADQLSLIRQSDRLQVTVTLNKHDNFDVLLVSEEEVRGYPVQTDTHPGMCVAVFNQPQTPDVSTLSQTISLENLEGVWHLYYLMNGKLLDPQQILTLE